MSEKEKILILADSLALPRPSVPYQLTWPALLKKERSHSDITVLASRRNSTACFNSESPGSPWYYGDSLTFYRPDTIIIQLGIVDCAPRYLKTRSLLYKAVMKAPSRIQSMFWKLYKSFSKRSEKRSDTPFRDFESNVNKYLEQCAENKIKLVIIILIALPAPHLIKRIPQMRTAIERYNEAYRTAEKKYPFVICVDPLSKGEADSYVEDGYHPNEKGHREIFEAINQRLTVHDENLL